MDPKLSAGLLIALGLATVIALMIVLARWARRRSKGALFAGAILSIFAPDPEFEKNIRMAERAKQVQNEEDEQGEDKDPSGAVH